MAAGGVGEKVLETMSLVDLLKKLTPQQLDFVAARLATQTDKAAAEQIGISPGTAYNWPNKSLVDEIISLAKQDTVLVAAEKLRRLTTKAVDVLDEEMDLRRRRLEAAKEVLDRSGLPAIKRQQIEASVDFPASMVNVVKRGESEDD